MNVIISYHKNQMRLRNCYKLLRPTYLVERIYKEMCIVRLKKRFRGTPASTLSWDLLGNAELLFAVKDMNIKNIVDIGANIGNWTIVAKSVFPSARIDAFEPVPSSAETLKTATSMLSDIHIHAFALGAQKGQTFINVLGKHYDCSSLLDPSDIMLPMEGQSQKKSIPVSVMRIDDVIKEGNMPYPDFIKMDVQGFELEVLKGSEDCLKTARAVQCEVSFEEFYKGQSFFRDIIDFLDDRGFRLAMFANYEPHTVFSQFDALFIKKDIK